MKKIFVNPSLPCPPGEGESVQLTIPFTHKWLPERVENYMDILGYNKEALSTNYKISTGWQKKNR